MEDVKSGAVGVGLLAIAIFAGVKTEDWRISAGILVGASALALFYQVRKKVRIRARTYDGE